MDMTTLAVVMVGFMVLLMFLGMNVGLSMLFVGFVGYGLAVNFGAAFGLLRTAVYTNFSTYTISVVPMFILMGNIAFEAGISQGIYKFASKWLARLPGNQACATVAASACFGAICGSAAATVATMGTIAIPEMRRNKYDVRLSTGAIAAGGTLGLIIPPSSAFILYGLVSETSIARLFVSGIIPGIILTALFVVTIIIIVKLKPDWAGPCEHTSFREKLASIKDIWQVVVLFGVVIGGIFFGVFTANEGAAIGCVMAALMMLLNGKFSIKVILRCVVSTVKMSGMIILLLTGASILVNFLAVTRLPRVLSELILAWSVSKYVVLLFVVVLCGVLGCLMDGAAVTLLCVPIFLPIMEQLGFDAIWFGVVIVLIMQLGQITPPVGLAAYVMAGVARDVPLSKIFQGVALFIPALLVCILVITIFPSLATWLPALSYG